MKYIVKSRETEIYEFRYMVEADSADMAEQKILDCDWQDVETIDDNYDSTVDREILEVEPYNDLSNP